MQSSGITCRAHASVNALSTISKESAVRNPLLQTRPEGCKLTCPSRTPRFEVARAWKGASGGFATPWLGGSVPAGSHGGRGLRLPSGTHPRLPRGVSASAGTDKGARESGATADAKGAKELATLLASACLPVSIQGDPRTVITGISQDSRAVKPGDLFVCVTGYRVDGHDYIAKAVEAGAAAVLVSKPVTVAGSAAIATVPDTNAVLPILAAAFFNHPSGRLWTVGVTGTNGKTTTAFIIKSILQATGLKTGLVGTISYDVGTQDLMVSHMTTPDAVEIQRLMAAMVDNDCRAVAMEASSHALVQGRVSQVQFDVAVFTNLTRDHLDFHKTFDAYRDAKAILFTSLTDKDKHRGVVNVDDPAAPHFINACKVPVITYAVENAAADVYPETVRLSLFETHLKIKTPQGPLEVTTKLIGRPNVSNICAAVAVALAKNIPLDAIRRGVEATTCVPGRAEVVPAGTDFAIVVDYAHTPDALERLLKTMRECGSGRLITVFGCGGDRDRGKRPMMGQISRDLSEISWVTSDNPRTEDPLKILEDIMVPMGTLGVPDASGRIFYANHIREDAIKFAVGMAKKGDIVVIAGKGHEDYQILGKETRHFSDKEEAIKAVHAVQEAQLQGYDTSVFPWKGPGTK